MNESELIKQAKTDNGALEKLLNSYEPMLYSLAKKFSIKGYTMDDLMQESRNAFCQAVKAFEDDKSKLSTFAYTFVMNRLKELQRAEMMLKRRAEIVSIYPKDDDGEALEIPSSKPNPEEMVIIEEERQEIGKALTGKLTQLEFDAAMLFAKGYSYADIAKLTNRTVKSIDNAMQRVKKKIKD